MQSPRSTQDITIAIVLLMLIASLVAGIILSPDPGAVLVPITACVVGIFLGWVDGLPKLRRLVVVVTGAQLLGHVLVAVMS